MTYDFYLEVDGEWHSSEDICKSIQRALKEGAAGREIVPERVEVLGNVFVGIYKITGKMPQMRFRPAFVMGSVSVDVPELQLAAEQSQLLAEVLQPCNTFELVALASGGVRVAATVKGVYRDKV